MLPLAGTNLAGIYEKDGIRATLVKIDSILKGLVAPDVDGLQVSRIVNENLTIDNNGIMTIKGVGDQVRIMDGALQFTPDGGTTWSAVATASDGPEYLLKYLQRNTDPAFRIASASFTTHDVNFFDRSAMTIAGCFSPHRTWTQESFWKRIDTADNNRLLMDFGKGDDHRLYLTVYPGYDQPNRTWYGLTDLPDVTKMPTEFGVSLIYSHINGPRVIFFANGVSEAAQDGGDAISPAERINERHIIGDGFVGDFHALAIANTCIHNPDAEHAPFNGSLSQIPTAVALYQADYYHIVNPALLKDIAAMARGQTSNYDLTKDVGILSYPWRM